MTLHISCCRAARWLLATLMIFYGAITMASSLRLADPSELVGHWQLQQAAAPAEGCTLDLLHNAALGDGAGASWTALHEHQTAKSNPADGNLISGDGSFVLNAQGNYVHAPSKFVAAVGIHNLVVVETEDALLITTREHAQDVGKVVKYLDERKLHKLV